MFILINTAFEKVISLLLCKQKRLTSSSAAHTSNYHAKEGAAERSPGFLCTKGPLRRSQQNAPKTIPELDKPASNSSDTACFFTRFNFNSKPPSYSLWTSPQTSKFTGKTQMIFLFSVVINSVVTGEFLPCLLLLSD